MGEVDVDGNHLEKGYTVVQELSYCWRGEWKGNHWENKTQTESDNIVDNRHKQYVQSKEKYSKRGKTQRKEKEVKGET